MVGRLVEGYCEDLPGIMLEMVDPIELAVLPPDEFSETPLPEKALKEEEGWDPPGC